MDNDEVWTERDTEALEEWTRSGWVDPEVARLAISDDITPLFP
jgi:hypothetical protein